MANKQLLRKLFSDAIPVLCRNGLPPSATFRVEALIGITVIGNGGGEENVTVLSFQQTVSDSGVVTSQFGSNDPVAAVPDDGRTVTGSHKPRKRSTPKQTPAATVTVKQEYSVETSVKQEYDGESYPPHATGHPLAVDMYDEYGPADTEEVEYVGEEGDYAGQEEEYYEDDGQYYDDGSGYAPDIKFESENNVYMEGGDGGAYMQTGYMTEDYGNSSAGRPPKPKVARSRQFAAGTQPGQSRVKKTGGTTRGGTRPRGGRASYDQATAVALAAAGATGSSNRGMLTNLAHTIADQSEVSSKFFCHICNACLASKTSLVTHIKGSHLAASLYTCDECGAEFKWYMQLHRHRRRFHGNGSSHHDDGSDYHSNEYLPETDLQ